MSGYTLIKTERLILRPWCESDLSPFAELNADPRVMEYFPAPLNREESNQLAKRMQSQIKERGWGVWAVSLKNSEKFIGFIGLDHIDHKLPFAPNVEIEWRLAYDYWGQGYATEGALESLKFGFEKLKLNEIVAFTPIQNLPSRAVMRKIGMHHTPADDFDHPKLSIGHPLRRHVLYRLTGKEWENEK